MDSIYNEINYSEKVDEVVDELYNINEEEAAKCSVLKILKCPSAINASKLISNTQLRLELLRKFPSLIAIKLIVDKEFNSKECNQPRRYEFESKNRFVIAFSTVDSDQMIIFWANNHSENFLRLSLNLENSTTAINNFAFDFIVKNLKHRESVISTDNNNVQLTNLVNSNGYDLLFDAAKTGNLSLVQDLTKHLFDVNREIKDNLKLIDFVWQSENNNRDEILLELLKANSMFPVNFNSFTVSSEVKKFLCISKEVHLEIERNNKEKVKEILTKHGSLRYFFNSNNVSAANVALQNQNFEIYKILAENGVTFGPDEIIENYYDDDVMQSKNEDVREEFCNFNSDISVNLPQHYIMKLLSKCVISHNDLNTSNRLKQVKSAFESLDSIPQIRPMLQVLAHDKYCKYHFDFTQNSAIYMDPTLSQSTRGVYNSANNHIHVAAKGLLNDATRDETLGVISHESFHSCFNLVFKNYRLPYAAHDDYNNKRKFQNIIKECELLKDNEEIVKRVFTCYDESAWGRELAVRVPHMFAHYNNDQDKLNELKETFKNLFDFHEKNVLPEIIAAVPVLQKLADEQKEIIFSELTEPLKTAILNSNVIFQDFETNLLKVLESKQSEVLKLLTSKQIREILDGKMLKISDHKIPKVDFYVERQFSLWDSFSLKKLFYNNEFKFDSVMTEIDSLKTFLLSDYAGEGKSTSMKHLSIILKRKNPEYWVSYVDLKQHLHIYEKFKDKILNGENVFKILNEILFITDKFEIELFSELFNSSKIILLLDGVDEISPKYKDFFIRIILRIQISKKVQLWIATRPQHIRDLSLEFETKVYCLKPFNTIQKDEFIQRYLKFKKCENPLKTAKNIKNSKVKLTENPLMLKMFIDLHIAGKFNLKKINRLLLYKEMIELKKDILAEQKAAIANRDTTIESKITLTEIHQAYALILLLSNDKKIDISKLQIIRKWQKEKENWTPEAISRCGILMVDFWECEIEKPEFVHRTFAEYFLATFLIDSVKEAIEANDNNELSEQEFDIRMDLAFYIISKYCNELSMDIVMSFIFDYFQDSQSTNIKFGRKFQEFIEPKATQYLLNILDGSNFSRCALFSLSFVSFFTINNELFIKTKYFQQLRDQSLKFVLNIDFDHLDDTEFKHMILICVKLLNTRKIINNDDIKKRLKDNFLNKIKSDDEVSDDFLILEQFYLFFLTIIKEKKLLHYHVIFVTKFVQFFPVVMLRSRLMIEHIFKICEKFFTKEFFAEKICLVFSNEISWMFIPNERLTEDCRDNLNFFFTRVQNFLKNDQMLMRKAFPNQYDMNLKCNVMHVQRFLLFSCFQMEKENNFYLKYCDADEVNVFLSQLVDSSDSVLEDINFNPEDMTKLDHFIHDIFGISTYLQFFIFSYNELNDILKICSIFIRNFGESDWENFIGYNIRNSKSVTKITSFDSEDNETSSLHRLLCMFINREIPLEKIEIFFNKHFKNIIIMCFKIEIFKPLIEKLINCLKINFSLPTIFKYFKDSEFQLFRCYRDDKSRNIKIMSHMYIVDHIYGYLDKMFKDNYSQLRNLLSAEFLITSIEFYSYNIINVYKKCFTRKEILTFLQQNFNEILLDQCNPKNWINFCSRFNNEYLVLDDLETFAHDDQVKNSLLHANFLYHILDLISKMNMQKKYFLRFINFNCNYIFSFVLRSCTLLSIFFELLHKIFIDDKVAIIYVIEQILSNIEVYTQNFSPSVAFKDLWEKIEEILSEEEMREILATSGLGHHSNLLIAAIQLDMKFLVNLYVKYCSYHEILELLSQIKNNCSDFAVDMTKVNKFLSQNSLRIVD